MPSSHSSVLHSDRLTSAGALLIPSRLSGADLAKLIKVCHGRRLALLTEAAGSLAPDVRHMVTASGLQVWDRTSEGDCTAASTAVQNGMLVICVPPAVTALAATNLLVPRTVLEDLCEWNLPVQPLGVDHPREFCLTVEHAGSNPESVLCFAPLISAKNVSLPVVQEALIAATAEAYSLRPVFGHHLGRLIVAGLKKHASVSIQDGQDNSATKYAHVFAAAAALSRHLRKQTKEPRIGIVLPPGRAGLIANLAAIFAGKVPVNLNYSAGKEAIQSAIKQAGIDRIVTADVIVRKMQTFPWPAQKETVFMERILPRMKGACARWLMLQKVLPAAVLSSLLGIPSKGGDDECALLFTSGSSGDPKGVVLSHRNLISNVAQFGARLNLKGGEKILGCLPLFHSFGCTVTLWFPVIEGVGLVTYPTPLEPPKLAELMEKHSVDVLLATPTFLRGYMRRVKVEQLASLKLIVTGAEKLPLNFEEEFRGKFGKTIMEGYGLTETSPVATVNLPDPPAGQNPALPARRLGSVGQLLPGVAIRISDPISGDAVPIDHSGMIWLHGPNIFPGYLKAPKKTAEVIQDGWFRTGDIGRVDADGFLHIEGRLSRFSKIGGEMVPHETVEEHINNALGLDGDAERRIAVVGVPDPDKGEALVLLSTVASEAVKQELIQLRYTLLERGVSSLWIPKRLVRVESIPTLASGKLDIKACERLAQDAAV
ncbi:MAG TPA: AMP-binding protein [Verrucomicrobiales bacterium]|nr:AMP-binding protein [Verrucomicrobiales bacterium]